MKHLRECATPLTPNLTECNYFHNTHYFIFVNTAEAS
jgi:hypothetical protein